MEGNADTRLAVFYIAAFAAVAVCTVLGAVGMALNWGAAMLFLYAAAALFGVLAVSTMISYFLGGGPTAGEDEER
ncbi:MAG: hypothetical protein ACOC7T_01170 [Planctomycetota bacterium]